jgi:hypothetical protein
MAVVFGHFPRLVRSGGGLTMRHKGAKWDNMEEILYSEQNIVIKHFLVATISKVYFEVMERLNPNRVEMECRCNGPLLIIFREFRYLHSMVK